MVKDKQKLYFNNNLKLERNLCGYSQEQMAEILALHTGFSISTSLYQKWERGEQSVTADQVIAVCSYFKIKSSTKMVERR